MIACDNCTALHGNPSCSAGGSITWFAWLVSVTLIIAIAFLQPVPEARADISVPDTEVIEAVDKVAPTV